MAAKDLRNSPMMAHLLDALDDGKDIGHYGRLVFTMVARHFMAEDELVKSLSKDKDFSEEQARGLVAQVQARGYSPPKSQRIHAWQSEQQFRICPSDDPNACNVYEDLTFPDEVYEHVAEYYEEKASA